MLHPIFDEALDDLLVAWRHHEVLRSGARVDHRQLGASRIRLDRARTRVRSFRLAVYPDVVERESAVLSVLCEVLDEMVHLRALDVIRVHGGRLRFTCLCGHDVIRSTEKSLSGR